MERATLEDKRLLKMLVRSRSDFQKIRKAVDNRLGRKADGSSQKIQERKFNLEDFQMLDSISEAARFQERNIEKSLTQVLRRFDFYNAWCVKTKGLGTIGSGWILSSINIYIASTVSKIWQYSGYNPGLVRGKQQIKYDDGTYSEPFLTNHMIRGDKLTPKFLAPFNTRLRTALSGIIAGEFIRSQNDYAMKFYYPYKARLEQEKNKVEDKARLEQEKNKVEDKAQLEQEKNKVEESKKEEAKAWCDVSKGHRDLAAKRYMMKMFEIDLYVAWRTFEGLPVRDPYAKEYLGMDHAA